MSAKLKIGTRGSALALAQAKLAAEALRAKGVESELVVVRTRGDVDLHSSLAEIGRGAFTDIFSEMIARGELDIAVHSAKDLPTDAAHDGFFCLPRADAQSVPIIAVTANAFAEDVAATAAAGMDAHISKPIDFKKLAQALEQLLCAGEKGNKRPSGS